jgi:hypothetical protein
MSEAVKNDTEKKLKPTDQGDRHDEYLGPQHFVAPLLHLEIGIINQLWEAFDEWVGGVVEITPPTEKDARKKVLFDIGQLNLATEEKKWQTQ